MTGVKLIYLSLTEPLLGSPTVSSLDFFFLPLHPFSEPLPGAILGHLLLDTEEDSSNSV